jgi:hypothetical protein
MGLIIDRKGGLQGPRPAQAIEAEIRKDWSGKRGFCGAKMRPKVKAGARGHPPLHGVVPTAILILFSPAVLAAG